MELSGKIIRSLYFNEDNLYSVYLFEIDDLTEDVITITGHFPQLSMDMMYRLHGEFVDHYRYGIQFKVDSITTYTPQDKTNIVTFISSSLFPGIGKKSAERLVDAYGEEILVTLKNNPSFPINPKILSLKQQESLRAGLERLDDLDETIALLTTSGITMRQAMKISAVYGDEAYQKITENPYQLLDDIDGIGFKTCDKLASKLGFDPHHPFRLAAICTFEVLQDCMRTGSTYTNHTVLAQRVGSYGLDEPLFQEGLALAQRDEKIIELEDKLFHKSQYWALQTCAHFFVNYPIYQIEDVHEDITERIQSFEETENIHYDHSQIEAIRNFFKHDKTIITGGPGTGKTTIVTAIIALCRQMYPSYQLSICAPTGRAAKRLKEMTNVEVTTIHSLLEWDLETNTFGRTRANPLDTDILIVDEFSMLDQWTMANLAEAILKVRKILFIGDQNQLPSVSPGFLIRDLIASSLFHTTVLEHNYRQKEGSQIIELAQQINQGFFDETLCVQDIRFYQTNTQFIPLLTNLVASALDSGYTISQIQIISTKYAGSHGIDALNYALQKAFNPAHPDKREIVVGSVIFRQGDKLLQLKNQPDDFVFNGDIGILVEVWDSTDSFDGKRRLVVDFDGTIVEYTPDTFHHLRHAYCVSVHKAQGSEHPIVMVIGSKQQRFMMQRRLLYTAVTRSSRALILVGDLEVFKQAAKTDRSPEIKTYLLETVETMQEGLNPIKRDAIIAINRNKD